MNGARPCERSEDPCLRKVAGLCPERLATALVRLLPEETFTVRALVAFCLWMGGAQPALLPRLRSVVRGVLLDHHAGDAGGLLELPPAVWRDALMDLVEEFLDRLGGCDAAAGRGWPGVWLLLNRWMERGVVLPDVWTAERLEGVATELAWSPPHMAALARREAGVDNGRLKRALVRTWREHDHHRRWTIPGLRLTYAEAWLTLEARDDEEPPAYLDFVANRWNAQLMLCAYIEAEHYEARYAVERALAAGDTTILPPWLAASVVVENLPAYARDVVALTVREPAAMIQDHAGLPVSPFQSLLGYALLGLRLGLTAETLGACMWSGWADAAPSMGPSAVGILGCVLDDDAVWRHHELGTRWRMRIAALLLYRYHCSPGAAALGCRARNKNTKYTCGLRARQRPGNLIQHLIRRCPVVPASADPIGEDTPGCVALLHEVLGQASAAASVRGAAMSLRRILVPDDGVEG